MASNAQNVQLHRNVTNHHMALHDFVGDWNLSQKVWTEPGAKPYLHKGTSKCVMVLDGIATLMTTDVPETKFKGAALMTYSKKNQRFDLAWVDTEGDIGLLVMNGQQRSVASHAALVAEFGKGSVQVREWGTALVSASACLEPDVMARVAEFASTAGRGGLHGQVASLAAPVVAMRLVENKISDSQWVLEFYVPGPNGTEFLVQQNTFSRAG